MSTREGKKNELLVPPRLSHPLSHRQRFGGKEGAWKWWEAKRFGSAELESRSPWVPVGYAAVPCLLSRHWECSWIQPHSNGEEIPPHSTEGVPRCGRAGVSADRSRAPGPAQAAGNPQELKNPFLKRRAEGNEKRSPTDSDPARCSVFKSTVLAWGTAE